MLNLDSPQKTIKTLTPATGSAIASRVSPWFANMAYPLGRYVVLPRYFGKIEVTGQEHLPQVGSVLLAPTHRSRWDALVVPYAAGRYVTHRDLHFMVSADEMKGLQGWFIRRFGGFPVDTDQPGIASFRHGVELLSQGEMLVVFPEGGIFRDDRIEPLKGGVARMALQAESTHPDRGVKIVPMSIRYSEPFPGWGSDVQVKIGSPLEVGNYLERSRKQAAQQLTTDLEAVLSDLYGS